MTTELTDEERAALNRAADLIEERGLAHGSGANGNGCLCTLGALCAALDLDPYDWSTPYQLDDRYTALVNGVASVVPDVGSVFNGGRPLERIWLWNDESDGFGGQARTQPEVVAKLREIAAA